MLVRKQILLEEEQDRQLQQLSYDYGISFSEIMRQATPLIVKKIKIKKNKKMESKKSMTGVEFLTWLAEHPVHGPGDSEYDKYAYDF